MPCDITEMSAGVLYLNRSNAVFSQARLVLAFLFSSCSAEEILNFFDIKILFVCGQVLLRGAKWYKMGREEELPRLLWITFFKIGKRGGRRSTRHFVMSTKHDIGTQPARRLMHGAVGRMDEIGMGERMPRHSFACSRQRDEEDAYPL